MSEEPTGDNVGEKLEEAVFKEVLGKVTRADQMGLIEWGQRLYGSVLKLSEGLACSDSALYLWRRNGSMPPEMEHRLRTNLREWLGSQQILLTRCPTCDELGPEPETYRQGRLHDECSVCFGKKVGSKPSHTVAKVPTKSVQNGPVTVSVLSTIRPKPSPRGPSLSDLSNQLLEVASALDSRQQIDKKLQSRAEEILIQMMSMERTIARVKEILQEVMQE